MQLPSDVVKLLFPAFSHAQFNGQLCGAVSARRRIRFLNNADAEDSHDAPHWKKDAVEALGGEDQVIDALEIEDFGIDGWGIEPSRKEVWGISVRGTSVRGMSVRGISVWDISVWDISVWDISARGTSVRGTSVWDISARGTSVRGTSVWDKEAWGVEALTEPAFVTATASPTSWACIGLPNVRTAATAPMRIDLMPAIARRRSRGTRLAMAGRRIT